jgi:hypothetical protein
VGVTVGVAEGAGERVGEGAGGMGAEAAEGGGAVGVQATMNEKTIRSRRKNHEGLFILFYSFLLPDA